MGGVNDSASTHSGQPGAGSVGGAGGDAQYAYTGGGGGGGAFGGGGGAADGSGSSGGGGSNLAPAGALKGRAATAGDGSVSVTFTACASSTTGTKPVFVHDTTPAATAGHTYSYTVTASGSPAPRFTVALGTLPAGLTLDPATGVLSGTPTTAGTYTFVLAATNSVGRTVTDPITLVVKALVVTRPTAPAPSVATLPFTGVPTAGLVTTGTLSILLGFGLRRLGRRSR